MCIEKNNTSIINNDDWEVTKEIYANAVVDEGVIAIKISTHDMVGIRRVIQEAEHDDNSKVLPKFEYFNLSELTQPSVRLSFQYVDDSLSCVDIQVKDFPSEYLSMQTSPSLSEEKQKSNSKNDNHNHSIESDNQYEEWIKWMQSETDQILQETQMSFSICNFVEHQALTYFNIVHRDDVLGYSAILFKDKLEDSLIQQEQQQQYEHLSTPWRNSKFFTALFLTRNQKLKNILPTNTLSSLDQYATFAIQEHWKEWITFECPICFDTDTCNEGIELPCRHFLCKTCAKMYIQTKISELSMCRHSPFICPIVSCKQAMKIQSGSYPLNNEDRKKIVAWKYDLTYPKSHMLSQCPRKACRSTDIRRASSELTETMVFCNTCDKAYCELCLKKFPDRECKWDHQVHNCDEDNILKLCRRYRNAKDEIKLKAEEKWHWLKDYASSREEDLSATLWINQNASRCPNCKLGIERIDGCFHMHCTSCGTHFCYECGIELHYPFYGTHHCWEEDQHFDNFD